MKKIALLLLATLAIFALCSLLFACSSPVKNDTVAVSGIVSDFQGNPIDSALVALLHADFSTVDSAYSDANGQYRMDVKKGKYYAMWVLKPEEYPSQAAVPPEDMRLEFWAWNIVADRDLEINPRYHRLELYRLNAFRGEGGALMLYVRPMSLGRSLAFATDENDDVTVLPENFEAKVFIDNEQVKINSIQSINEFTGKNTPPLMGYIIQVNLTKATDRPYYIIRVEGTNLEYNEKGESVCFYEVPDYL